MAGQYFDAETGLHYNFHRYYDPKLGRYLQVDPLGDGLNLYAYCFNNPNSLMDPMGLCAIRDFFTLEGQANFWAGFGDFLTSGFGLTYLFDVPSFTEWVRIQCGSDYVVDRDSLLYAAGAATGDVVGSFIGEAVIAKIGGKALRAVRASEKSVNLPSSMKNELSAYKKAAAEGKLVKTKSSNLPRSKARKVWEDANGPVPDGYDVDHIIQRQHGGTDDLSNLQLKTSGLNRSEGAKAYHLNKTDPYGTTYNDVRLVD